MFNTLAEHVLERVSPSYLQQSHLTDGEQLEEDKDI
jgi:hypothetical protein